MSASETQIEPPAEPAFRLKLVPILVVFALGVAVPFASAFAAYFTVLGLHLPIQQGANLGWLYLQHSYQLLLALVAIAVLKFWLVPADYGLRLPRGRSYILPAILWGGVFGVLMTVVDYAPQILSHSKPDLGYAPTPANVSGWIVFSGVYVGPTEEIPFRALLVTYLATAMPGKLHIGRFNMNWAGVIAAVIFALLHATSFFSRPWPQALGQQAYAFGLGVLYAYWLEKSKSVLAPVIGHNVSDVVETVILLAWVGVFAF